MQPVKKNLVSEITKNFPGKVYRECLKLLSYNTLRAYEQNDKAYCPYYEKNH